MHNISITVRIVREIDTMGTLFQVLCHLEGYDKKVRLLGFQAHRFRRLTRVLEQIIYKWESEVYYRELREDTCRTRSVPFPITGKLDTSIHLHSLMRPITELNKYSQVVTQAQVQTLLLLSSLRIVVLNEP